MDLNWPWTKRIRVNKPIDWAKTWSLEQQARGISFEMDDQKNLKAVPVVLIDTTAESIVPSVSQPLTQHWAAYRSQQINAGTYPLVPNSIDWTVWRVELAAGGQAQAVAGWARFFIMDSYGPYIVWEGDIYIPAAAGTDGERLVLNFNPGYHNRGMIYTQTPSTLQFVMPQLTTGMWFTAWSTYP